MFRKTIQDNIRRFSMKRQALISIRGGTGEPETGVRTKSVARGGGPGTTIIDDDILIPD